MISAHLHHGFLLLLDSKHQLMELLKDSLDLTLDGQLGWEVVD
jgi:hypothetical protein